MTADVARLRAALPAGRPATIEFIVDDLETRPWATRTGSRYVDVIDHDREGVWCGEHPWLLFLPYEAIVGVNAVSFRDPSVRYVAGEAS